MLTSYRYSREDGGVERDGERWREKFGETKDSSGKKQGEEEDFRAFDDNATEGYDTDWSSTSDFEDQYEDFGGWSGGSDGGNEARKRSSSSFSSGPGPRGSRENEEDGGFGYDNYEPEQNTTNTSYATDSSSSSSSSSASFSSSSSSGGSSLALWPLQQDELHELFPLSGTPGQYSYYWGSWDEAIQRFALSLLITLLATNNNSVLAAGAFSYSVWGPIIQSMLRNLSVKKYPYGGFWEATLLDLSFKNDSKR